MQVLAIVRDSSGLTSQATATIEVTGSDPWAALDGRGAAPTGAAQFPSLLNSYAVRPPWKVAGIDYRVGINTGVVLKNPATATLPPNCTRDTNARFLFVNGNTTVDGFSFTGGWQCLVFRGTNVVIQNCDFSGSGFLKFIAHSPADSGQAIGGVVRYCKFVYDGIRGCSFLGFVGGTWVIEYNHFENIGSMHVQMSRSSGDPNLTNILMRYNLFKDAGGNSNAGAHGDYTQFLGDLSATRIEFNTAIQAKSGSTHRTQGYSMEDIGLTMDSLAWTNNTCMAPSGTNTNYFLLFGRQRIRNAVNIKQNYVDRTAGTILYQQHDDQPGPQNPLKTVSGNINMVTGAAYNP